MRKFWIGLSILVVMIAVLAGAKPRVRGWMAETGGELYGTFRTKKAAEEWCVRHAPCSVRPYRAPAL